MFSVTLALVLSVAVNSVGAKLQNPGFESAPFLTGWTVHARAKQENGRAPSFTADRRDAKEGGQSLLIDAPEPADADASQTIFLPVGSLWRVTTWIKTQDLGSQDRGSAAGLIEVASPIGDLGSSGGGSGTAGWHEAEATFRVPSPGSVTLTLVAVRGGTGKVWFDDVRLEALPTATREEVRVLAGHATRRPVDAKQQGQFIEILCNLIPSIIAQQVWSTSFEEAPPCKFKYKKEIDEPFRPWYSDGAVEVARYSFDTSNPFNGARSQKIELPVDHARAGISEDGFYLKQGVSYKLHVHMRSEGDVRVRAWLHGGGQVVAGPVPLGHAGEVWAEAQGELRSTRTIDNATLTVDFEGPGTLWLDRIYLIGSDAVLGIWRPDAVAALKDMHPGIIRFGGSTTEDYEWERGIGPWDRRQPFTTVWGGLEENFVGIDEFIQLCQYVGAEPLICVRWTGKKPEDAAAEVEYCNGSVDTPWGKRRAQNGHPAAYHVKYFQIGNEVGNPKYDTSVRAFADAMKKADPSIKVLSSFPTPSLLEAAGAAFDYLCPHHYEIGDLAGENRSFQRLEEWIARNAKGRDVRVAVTEWNTTAGDWGLPRGILQTLGNALGVSRYLNLLERRADLVEIANRSNFADSFGSGFILTGPGWIYKSPTYYAQELYARAAGSYPLRLERSSPLPWQLQEPDLSATLGSNGKTLRLYAVNSTPQAISTEFRLEGFSTAAKGAAVYTLEDRDGGLTSEVMNSRDNPRRVALSVGKAALRGRVFEFTFKPFTVTLLELELAGESGTPLGRGPVVH